MPQELSLTIFAVTPSGGDTYFVPAVMRILQDGLDFVDHAVEIRAMLKLRHKFDGLADVVGDQPVHTGTQEVLLRALLVCGPDQDLFTLAVDPSIASAVADSSSRPI